MHSIIRQNIVEILYFLGKGYGYDIYKIYCELFPKVTLRSIYYHLRKGVSLEEFKIEKIVVEHGNYSWGNEVEKIYYSLGKNAQPKMLDDVKKYFDDKQIINRLDDKETNLANDITIGNTNIVDKAKMLKPETKKELKEVIISQ